MADLACLPHPDRSADTFQLVTDSSNFAVGSALHQMVKGEPQPIGFFSKKLTDSQRKYSAYDRELLAAYYSVIHFKPLIECRNVTIFTDHKPLVNAFKSKVAAKSDRQQRHLSLISELVSDMKYIRGDQNIVAYCMSRAHPIAAVSVDSCDLPALPKLQEKDNETQIFKDRLVSYQLSEACILLCDKSTIHPRPFVPSSARESIFNEMHSLCHPGIKATLRHIKSRYFWPNMDKDIRERCKFCTKCQKSKIHRPTKSLISL